MRGYLGREDLTALAIRGGWLATGDIGTLDARGRLHLRGREREEINRGGLKVYPGDVDAVIERCEAALDGCAFGYDDGLGQEDVGVAVVLRGGSDASMRAVYDWARRHLAPHQMPRRWYAVDEIPRTARGKVNRAQVAARCASLRPVDVREAAARAGAAARAPSGPPAASASRAADGRPPRA
jgi:oxalate---CoA ligase